MPKAKIPSRTHRNCLARLRTSVIGATLLSAALNAAPSVASADTSLWHFDLGFGTSLMTSAGGEIVVEGPYRLLLRSGLGWMPKGYVEATNRIMTGLGAYSELDATLIEAALQNSLLVPLALGWRPFEDWGLELYAGYTFGALGGGLTPVELLEAATGRNLDDSGAQQLDVETRMHAFTVGAGWRFVWKERWVLRIGLEYFQILDATSKIQSDSAAPTARRAAIRQAVFDAYAAYLDGLAEDYVKLPTLRLHAAYRF